MCLATGKYVCVNCGSTANSLYKEYATGVLKISLCENCGKMVDPYIEIDISIILIDTALQRVSAYRHFLLNFPPIAFWKFGLVSLLCDAYKKWALQKHRTENQQSYFELEWAFYVACMKSALETCLFFLGIGIMLSLTKLWSQGYKESATLRNVPLILSNLVVVAGCSKLFTVPIFFWSWYTSEYNDILITAFILISLIQASKAMVNSMSVALTAIAVGFGFQYATSYFLESQQQLVTEQYNLWISRLESVAGR